MPQQFWEGMNQISARLDDVNARLGSAVERITEILQQTSQISERLRQLNGSVARNIQEIDTLKQFTLQHPLECQLIGRVGSLEQELRDRQRGRGRLHELLKYLWPMLLVLISALVGHYFPKK